MQKSKDNTNLTSLDPFLSCLLLKIIKKIICNQIYKFKKKHKYITNTQFGFQKQLWTDNCLNLLNTIS